MLSGGMSEALGELKRELFGNPETAISDLKMTPGENRDVTPDEVATAILAAIRDIWDGGGREIDLSI